LFNPNKQNYGTAFGLQRPLHAATIEPKNFACYENGNTAFGP